MDAGTLPTSTPPRRWIVGADSPVSNPLTEVPLELLGRMKEAGAAAPGTLPTDYGDPNGLWITVRRHDPFDVLLLDHRSDPSPDAILVRFRILWKFWTQKLTVARQGATRTAVRNKYGEAIESYIDNLQWAYDQLSGEGGVQFWRAAIADARSKSLWSRMSDVVDATLADGVLDVSEVRHLMTRAEAIGYDREEFALLLRDALYVRRFEPEVAPAGDSKSAQLESVRWATAEAWARIRAAAESTRSLPVRQYYLRARATGAVVGPVPAGDVPAVARIHALTGSDAICVVGASLWTAIAQSEFGHVVPGDTATYGCPRCGELLTSWTAASPAGWIVLIIGLLTSWVYVGIPLLIVGIAMLATRTRTSHWRCGSCGYVS